jgi:hypothetical protein
MWRSHAKPDVQKFYESKQYKKGIKAAETILKKFPDHGWLYGLIFYKLNQLFFSHQSAQARHWQ